MKDKPLLPLCYRCHHRARFCESGGAERPRYECGDTLTAVHNCYMFRPCKPLLLMRAKGDRRIFGGPAAFAARMNAVGEVKGEWTLRRRGRAWIMGWKDA